MFRHLLRRKSPTDTDALYDQTYFCHEAIDNYVDFLGGLPSNWTRKYNYGATAAGPTASVTLEKSSPSQNYHKKVNWLLEELRRRNLLSDTRPASVPGHILERTFVIERTIARCYTIPQSYLPADMKMAAFRLWVNEPSLRTDFRDEWDWDGSYLFLTELHLDSSAYHHIYSGCSALRMIANSLKSRHPLFMEGEEILGRFDKRPITEKILELGGLPSQKKEIQVVYRIRYMTDEQWHAEPGGGRRVHDILGYPLMIRSKPIHLQD